MGKKKAKTTKKKAKKKPSKYHEKVVINGTFGELIKLAVSTPPKGK